jgi:aromatic-L-amino-acid decarboxylase
VSGDFTPDRIQLPPEEMRRFGYRVIDLLVDHFSHLDREPAGRKRPRAELEAKLREPIPQEPGDPEALLQLLERDVFSNILHVDHPRFFAFVPGPNNFVSTMADALSAGFNVFVGTWFGGSAAAQVELVTIDWLREICGMPETAGGLFVSGGSMANLTGLAAARHHRLEGRMEGAVAYTSDQTHSSVLRAFRVLGFAPEQVRVLPSDRAFRLSTQALREVVAADRAAGRRPFCVVANAGTTNTGAVDPLADLVGLCREQGLWLHVDGAFGAPAVLTGPGRALLEGLGEADSLSLDPHKWLFQSFETGCVLVREKHLLHDTFQIVPEYLRDTVGAEEEINFGNYGVQLTRSFRALKLWMSFKTFGLKAFREAIARGIHLAEVAEDELRRSPRWEVVTPATLGVVTFRYHPEGVEPEEVDALHGRMVGEMLEDGYAVATSTVLRGRPVLRLCTINPRTTEDEVRETVRRLEGIGERLAGEKAQPHPTEA